MKSPTPPFEENAVVIGKAWHVTSKLKRDKKWKQTIFNNRTEGFKMRGMTPAGIPANFYMKKRDCRLEAFLITLCRCARVPVQRMYLVGKNEFYGLSEMLPTFFNGGDWRPEAHVSDSLNNVEPAKLGAVMAAILYLERTDGYGKNVLIREIDPFVWHRDMTPEERIEVDNGGPIPKRYNWKGDISLIDLKFCSLGTGIDRSKTLENYSVAAISKSIRSQRALLQEQNPEGLPIYDAAFKDTWERFCSFKGWQLRFIASAMLPGTWFKNERITDAIELLIKRRHTKLESLGLF